MRGSWEEAWRGYVAGVEVMQGAIQQLSLVPLHEMETFLQEAIEATAPDAELPRRKIIAARRQLDLIRVSQHYMSEVQALLKNGAA
jgi:hypothetical protein